MMTKNCTVKSTAEFELSNSSQIPPQFDFNLYVDPVSINTEELDLFSQLITTVKRNSLLNNRLVRVFVKTRRVNWFHMGM